MTTEQFKTSILPTPPYMDGDWHMEALCRECKGHGIIWNPVWKAWTEQWRSVGEPDLDTYTGDHPMPEDSEELTCGECEGSGWELTFRGRALIAFLQRHMGHRS